VAQHTENPEPDTLNFLLDPKYIRFNVSLVRLKWGTHRDDTLAMFYHKLTWAVGRIPKRDR
jgi:hypothetical protein